MNSANKTDFEKELTLDNREVIYMDLDDEVTMVFERIRRSRGKQLILVIPVRAMLLQSLVSLKILRFKAENIGKQILIVTKDEAGRNLAAEAGLQAAEKVKLDGKNIAAKEIISAEEAVAKPVRKIQRKRLKIVEAFDSLKEKLEKLSRDEIPMGKFRPAASAKKLWGKISGTIEEEDDASDSSAIHLIVKNPSRKVLFGLLGVAATLLFFIVYIAVPTATIYITPRADPFSKVVNITLKTAAVANGPATAGAHVVASEFFDFDFSKEVRIGATGQIFEGTNTKGVITVFNRSNKEKFIVPSRFRSQDGIIFRSKKAVTIPAAVGSEPGSIHVEVEACQKDDASCDCINAPDTCKGEFVGARGNVGPSFFTMPAIPNLSPAMYWAESAEPMKGGTTKVKKFISKDDLDNVGENVKREVARLGKIELTTLIAQKNQLENRNLKLLDNAKTIEVVLVSLNVPSGLQDKFQEDFGVQVKARVRAVAYEDDDMRALLFDQLSLKVHPEKVLTKVKFENVAFRIDDAQLAQKYVKLSATIEGVEEYDVSEQNAAGARLVEKLRSRILGKPIAESEAYIRNLPEVNSAVISSWPFWAQNIPDLAENVRFKISR
ncbi:MAG: hypothetical protein PHO48_05300 [Candidatus Gracilibacteria bacterium]|nr:hypothetical protein [Candidatus Gracilibacteria bacterium]